MLMWPKVSDGNTPTFGSLIRAKYGGRPGGAAKSVPSCGNHLGAKTKANREAFDDNEPDPTGGCLAWLVYRYLGLRFVARGWFNLDAAWATDGVGSGTLPLRRMLF